MVSDSFAKKIKEELILPREEFSQSFKISLPRIFRPSRVCHCNFAISFSKGLTFLLYLNFFFLFQQAVTINKEIFYTYSS